MIKLCLNRVFVRIFGVGLVLASAAHLNAAQTNPLTQTPIDRSLLDKYCVTCHNEKLKTGGLALDNIDVNNVRGNAEVLEKMVRKLRSQQMPPEGRPRPEPATLDKFTATLETALDRAAQIAPDPGRVAAHRLNRAEYVNVIHDLLALDIDGTELLPSDMAGFGFDNNADVLKITPGLLARYMSAATKISRLALASPDNRPMMRLYKVEIGTMQNARMSEDMPFATHGGLAVHHTFPLDGEYVFRMRLKRNATVGTIEGIEEDTSQIELRIDHGLVRRFGIGGEFKGPDPGVLIAVPEDGRQGPQLPPKRRQATRNPSAGQSWNTACRGSIYGLVAIAAKRRPSPSGPRRGQRHWH